MRTGLWVAKCAVAVLIMVTVTSAMAQGQGGGRRGGRGGGFGGVQPLTLLQNDKVQADLVLSEDQKSQVAKLVEENMGQRGQRGQRGQVARAAPGGAGGFAAAAQQRRDEEMKKINEVLLRHSKSVLCRFGTRWPVSRRTWPMPKWLRNLV